MLVSKACMRDMLPLSGLRVFAQFSLYHTASPNVPKKSAPIVTMAWASSNL